MFDGQRSAIGVVGLGVMGRRDVPQPDRQERTVRAVERSEWELYWPLIARTVDAAAKAPAA